MKRLGECVLGRSDFICCSPIDSSIYHDKAHVTSYETMCSGSLKTLCCAWTGQTLLEDSNTTNINDASRLSGEGLVADSGVHVTANKACAP
jgi:hypothetical protein